MAESSYIPTRLLRKREVLAITGVREYSTIWRWVKDGNFPPPLQLNTSTKNSTIAWKASDIEAWINSRQRGFGQQVPRPHHKDWRATHENGLIMQSEQPTAPEPQLIKPPVRRVRLLTDAEREACSPQRQGLIP
jgi:predicted DNA-binding transcriptional regulator AlpA